jgi:hypothetical protein
VSPPAPQHAIDAKEEHCNHANYYYHYYYWPEAMCRSWKTGHSPVHKAAKKKGIKKQFSHGSFSDKLFCTKILQILDCYQDYIFF